ncbi:IclR family transcriptional regulator [Cohnella abietis]|uniref:DNA-binding transcriptional regulator KdgR n=1 Tax=Cohnella abietis TaxID=2507935 RepID=A0A3T1D1E7_9BACL|nr:IclR family transcriptional regulator [Cohnella abietis]BBI31878.1 DNA-binding transcriptional regulator KdgR [Cohnella abietis]
MSGMDTDQLQTLDRGLEVMMRLVERDGAWGVAELSLASGFNKSTTFRILRTLQRRGFVSQLPDGKYEARVEIFQFIMDRLSDRLNVQRVARSELERLASEVKETVTLSIISNRQVKCLDKVDSTAAVHVTHLLGRLSPIHLGSSGKAILAFLEQQEQDSYMDPLSLKSSSENAIIDVHKLTNDLEITRRVGYSESHQELDQGVSAVAAPIFDRFGRINGSLTILGFTQDFTSDITKQYGEAVKKAAATISVALGYSLVPRTS